MRELHNKVRRQRYRENSTSATTIAGRTERDGTWAPGVIRCTARTTDLAVISVAGHFKSKAGQLGHGMSQTPEAPAAPIGSTVAVKVQGSSHQSGVGGSDCQVAVALCGPTGPCSAWACGHWNLCFSSGCVFECGVSEDHWH